MTNDNINRETCNFLSFQIGNRRYACDAVNLQEIITRPNFRTTPLNSSFIVGLFEGSRGKIPVIDFFCRDIDDSMNNDSCVIVLRAENSLFGLLVDEISEMIEISPYDSLPVPPIFGGIEGEFIRGVVEYQDEDYYLIDLNRIISTVDGGLKVAPGTVTEEISKE